ncbi:hypothetical protein ACSSWA_02340 [Melioribacter sp. Ez-97]|uniref:hypothetical protein n=1 Tax=Melioribacter sp. Ez-97 TaxID=3423434 RepID=UPI003EDB41B9
MNLYKNYFSYLNLLRGGILVGVLFLINCSGDDKNELLDDDMKFATVTDSVAGYLYNIPPGWREETPAEVKSISKSFKNTRFRIVPHRIFYNDSTNSILSVSRILFSGGSGADLNRELYLDYLKTRFKGNVNRSFINGQEATEINIELGSNINEKYLFVDEGEMILFDFTTGIGNSNNEFDIIINTVKKIP